MLGIRISHTAHCFKIVQQAASWKTSHAQKQTTQNTRPQLTAIYHILRSASVTI